MNISIKAYHTKPTYEELIQDAVINPTELITYPNRFATQLRNTPQLTLRFKYHKFKCNEANYTTDCGSTNITTSSALNPNRTREVC
jgi:hypothetical protein